MSDELQNSEEDSTSKNKKLSAGLKALIDEANIHAKSAEEKIKEAYEYAINVDKLDPKQAAKVLYENLTYSPQWIRRFLPQEAKHIEMRRLPSKIAKADSQIEDNVPEGTPAPKDDGFKDHSPDDVMKYANTRWTYPSDIRLHTKEELDKMMESDAQAMDEMNKQAKEYEQKVVNPNKIPDQSYEALSLQRDNLITRNKELEEYISQLEKEKIERQSLIEQWDKERIAQRQNTVAADAKNFKTVYVIYPSAQSKAVKWKFEFEIDPIAKKIINSQRIME